MEKTIEETTPQNTVVEETPKVAEEVKPQEEVQSRVIKEETPALTQEQIDDLKHKAEVSSQNFERAKKAEEELKELKQLQDNTVLSDYEDENTEALRNDVSELKQELAMAKVIKLHPEMEEVWDKFEEFQNDPDNKGMNLNTAAKAFRIENGLAEPKRKGLETATGGDKIIPSSGMTSEQVKDLRENHYDKYRKMLKNGQIKFIQ